MHPVAVSLNSTEIAAYQETSIQPLKFRVYEHYVELLLVGKQDICRAIHFVPVQKNRCLCCVNYNVFFEFLYQQQDLTFEGIWGMFPSAVPLVIRGFESSFSKKYLGVVVKTKEVDTQNLSWFAVTEIDLNLADMIQRDDFKNQVLHSPLANHVIYHWNLSNKLTSEHKDWFGPIWRGMFAGLKEGMDNLSGILTSRTIDLASKIVFREGVADLVSYALEEGTAEEKLQRKIVDIAMEKASGNKDMGEVLGAIISKNQRDGFQQGKHLLTQPELFATAKNSNLLRKSWW